MSFESYPPPEKYNKNNNSSCGFVGWFPNIFCNSNSNCSCGFDGNRISAICIK